MSRKLGQVFLKNQKIAQKIVKELEIKKGEIIVEIGPGTGFLTQELILSNEKIIAIEKDPKLIGYLKEKFANNKNLILIEGDIREILKEEKIQEIIQSKDYNKGYKIVGNIPYYLTSYLLRLLMNLQSKQNKPKLVVLMVQKEVAERIVAQPPKMNLLAVLTQFYFQSKIIQIVKKGNFSPPPKVDSAIIKLIPLKNQYISNPKLEKKFIQLVKAGFSQPRKTLLNNLKTIIPKEKIEKCLLKTNLQLTIRPAALSLDDWLKIFQELVMN